MIRLFTIAFATICVAIVAYVTLVKGAHRPTFVGPDQNYYISVAERFCAFAVLGTLVALAMPRRPLSSIVVVIVLATGFEALQTLQPDRHPTALDALQKTIGGLTGLAAGHILRRRFR